MDIQLTLAKNVTDDGLQEDAIEPGIPMSAMHGA